MKYVITIDERFWPLRFPEWKQMSDEDRRQAMDRMIIELHQWCEGDDYGCVAVLPKFFNALTEEAKAYITISPLVPSEGIARIQEERDEQRAKHGFSDAHDDALDGSELEYAAAAVLTEDPVRWPASMDKALFLRATEKGTLGRLAVAGALIAAEMDRIERQLARQGGSKPVGPTLPPEGTRVMVRTVPELLFAAKPLTDADFDRLMQHEGRELTIRSAELREDGVWVSLGDALPMVPLACCTIIHPEQPIL